MLTIAGQKLTIAGQKLSIAWSKVDYCEVKSLLCVVKKLSSYSFLLLVAVDHTGGTQLKKYKYSPLLKEIYA